MINNNSLLATLFAISLVFSLQAGAQKPRVTLDEFFNSVGFTALQLSPDGNSAVIGVERVDWDQQAYRKDLWLYRDDGHGNGNLGQLTRSGHDTNPAWSPDGHWIAFLSERKTSSGKNRESADDSDGKEKEITQLYLISPSGGESFPVTQGDEEVHAFSWSSDSRTLYFATRVPWNKEQQDAYKKDWKDVIQYRAAERGDMIFSISVDDAVGRELAAGTKEIPEAEKHSGATPGARALATIPWRIEQLETSPDGRQFAFVTTSISERQEKINEFEIYVVDLANASPERAPRQLTHNEAVEQDIHWARDGRHVFFRVDLGSVEGKYKDTQTRLYWVDSQSGEVQRWAGDFGGAVGRYAVTREGSVLAPGRLGTEVQIFSQAKLQATFTRQGGWPGTYEVVAAADHSPRVAFIYSSLEHPTEVYLADSADKLQQARP